jgi:hypothetical protein
MTARDRVGRNPFQKTSSQASSTRIDPVTERASKKTRSSSRPKSQTRRKNTSKKNERNLVILIRELLLELLTELKRALRQLIAQISPSHLA